MFHTIRAAMYNSDVLRTNISSPHAYVLYLDDTLLKGAMQHYMRNHGIMLQTQIMDDLGYDREGGRIFAQTVQAHNIFTVRIRKDVQHNVSSVGKTHCRFMCVQYILAHEFVHILVGILRLEHRLDDDLWSVLVEDTDHDPLFFYILYHLFQMKDEKVD